MVNLGAGNRSYFEDLGKAASAYSEIETESFMYITGKSSTAISLSYLGNKCHLVSLKGEGGRSATMGYIKENFYNAYGKGN